MLVQRRLRPCIGVAFPKNNTSLQGKGAHVNCNFRIKNVYEFLFMRRYSFQVKVNLDNRLALFQLWPTSPMLIFIIKDTKRPTGWIHENAHREPTYSLYRSPERVCLIAAASCTSSVACIGGARCFYVVAFETVLYCAVVQFFWVFKYQRRWIV